MTKTVEPSGIEYGCPKWIAKEHQPHYTHVLVCCMSYENRHVCASGVHGKAITMK